MMTCEWKTARGGLRMVECKSKITRASRQMTTEEGARGPVSLQAAGGLVRYRNGDLGSKRRDATESEGGKKK